MTRIAAPVRTPWLALAALLVAAYIAGAKAPPSPAPMYDCVYPPKLVDPDTRDALRQLWAAALQSFDELTPEAAVGEAWEVARTLYPLEVAR